MTIIWYMVPEIWSAPDRIFFPSCTIFCPFTPLPAWKMKMSKKWKNAWIYHNFTQVYQTLWSQTVPEIWHVIDVLVIFHLGLYFLLLPPLPPSNSPKNKNLKKEWKKKSLEISFYTSVPKIMVICHTVPEIWHMTDVIVTFHFGLFFTLLPP